MAQHLAAPAPGAAAPGPAAARPGAGEAAAPAPAVESRTSTAKLIETIPVKDRCAAWVAG
jgi:hypothetical protein